MSFSPLLNADLAIQIHAFAALEAIVLLPFALFRKRKDRLHKIIGYAWVTNMLVAAFSSFWISNVQMVGPFGPIHALSLLVIFNMGFAIWHVRRGNIWAHQQIMKQTALWGLGVAGALTFVPGRIMHEVAFGAEVSTGPGFASALSIVVLVASVVFVVLRAPRFRKLG